MTWIWIVIGMLLAAVLVLFVMARILMRRVLRAGARLAIHAAWAKVGSHPHGTLKVVEADKILDEALRLLGYTGTLGEKLKKAGPRFTDLDAVWKAHKLRNKLVHQLDTAPRDAEVERAVESFRRALNDLGAAL